VVGSCWMGSTAFGAAQFGWLPLRAGISVPVD
jgi:hypothetical protein